MVLVSRKKIPAVIAGQGVDGHLIFMAWLDGGDGAAGPAAVYQACIFIHECTVFEIFLAIGWSLISDDRRRRNMQAMKVELGPVVGGATGTSSDANDDALIKKIIKFSSYIRKFRMEQLHSHI